MRPALDAVGAADLLQARRAHAERHRNLLRWQLAAHNMMRLDRPRSADKVAYCTGINHVCHNAVDGRGLGKREEERGVL